MRRLTPADCDRIVSQRESISAADLATLYGVHVSTIHRVLTRPTGKVDRRRHNGTNNAETHADHRAAILQVMRTAPHGVWSAIVIARRSGYHIGSTRRHLIELHESGRVVRYGHGCKTQWQLRGGR